MKRIFLILSAFLGAFLLLSHTASAKENSTPEYTVRREGEALLLFEGNSDEPCFSGTEEEMFSEISGHGLVYFDSVEIKGEIALTKGNFTIGGRLIFKAGGFSVFDGTSLLLYEAAIDATAAEDSVIDILGGEVILHSSSIASSAADCAVILSGGSLEVFSGSIKNTVGGAIKSSSRLSLLADADIDGAVVDIFAASPISLSDGTRNYESRHPLSVKYDAAFEKGSAYGIFTGASDEKISKITLFDRVGKEYDLHYLEELSGTPEVGAVYLPYKIRFFDDGRELDAVYRLRGEKISPPMPLEKAGYEFLYWAFFDGEALDADGKAESDLTLYAKHKLLAPTFKISSLDTVYTAEEQVLSFDEITHPLDGKGGFYELVWYKGDRVVSRGAELSLKSTLDSGQYSCKITYFYAADTASVVVENIGVNIRKMELKPPTLQSVAYDGDEKFPTELDGTLYSFSPVGFTEVGAYEIIIELRDKQNYKFLATDSYTYPVIFEITRAENRFTTPPKITDFYEGTSASCTASALFGEAYFLFSEDLEGEYSRTVPRAAGTYYAYAVVDEGKNHAGLIGEKMRFEILPDACVSLEILKHGVTEYTAFDKFTGDGARLLAKYKSGREETLDFSSVSVRYQRGNYLRHGDGGVILSYGGISITYPVSVKQAEYDLSGLDFPKYEIIFDGRYHEYSLPQKSIVGKDGIALGFRAVGGGTEAGEYRIKIIFSTESTDYKTPDEIEADMRVLPMSVELMWENTSFVYDGTKKLPTCSYTDAYGIVRRPGVSGEKIGAGTGYTATVRSDNPSYSFENPTCLFEIKKGSYNLSTVEWVGCEFVYSGKEISVSLTGLPVGVSVIGYTDSSATDAGTYMARATLSYDEKNYNKPIIEPHEWKIHKASYAMGSFKIEDNEARFDGKTHYPLVLGEVPVGLDGIPLSYSFSCGAVHAAEGRVSVRVDFSTESKNYGVPESKICFVTVLPKEITVEWLDTELSYTGNAQLPRAECEECEIEVLGAEISAGKYTATAKSKSSDYTVKNSTCAFEIKKAENRFLDEITLSEIYTGEEIDIGTAALFGEIEILVYSDIACTRRVEITRGGNYYLVFLVAESENYLELRSGVHTLRVIDLSVVEMSAELLKSEFFAFEEITDSDIRITVLYNSGAERVVPLSEIELCYPRADSLRFGDGEISLGYLGYTMTLEISVSKAIFDLSGVSFDGLSHTYDGTAKRPEILGLPTGITLVGFEGGECINAGEYYLTPLFEYDRENYAEIAFDMPKMVINKQIVPSRCDFSVEYDGSVHTPKSESPLCFFSHDGEIKNAGEYEIAIVLNDAENYALEGGRDKFVLTVLPREIHIKVFDIEQNGDESYPEAKYEITKGSVAEGEALNLKQTVLGERVTLTTDNGNYRLVVTDGAVKIPDRVRGDATVALITASAALVIMLALFAVCLIRKRFYRIPTVKTEALAAQKPPKLTPEISANEEKKLVVAEKTGKTEIELPKIKDIKELQQEKPTEAPPTVDADIEKEGVRIDGLMERAEKIGKVSVDMEKADNLITDALARDLVKRSEGAIKTTGVERGVINVDTLSEYFYPGERVDINILKRRGLIPNGVSYIKVLARGRIDKPLSVYANEFTPAAVKMIVLCGGEAIKAQTVREKDY